MTPSLSTTRSVRHQASWARSRAPFEGGALTDAPARCQGHRLLPRSCCPGVRVLAPLPQALVGMDDDPNDGFHKLNFLLAHPPFPPETFGNLLLLHCKCVPAPQAERGGKGRGGEASWVAFAAALVSSVRPSTPSGTPSSRVLRWCAPSPDDPFVCLCVLAVPVRCALALCLGRYGYFELAADILAENAHLTFKFLPAELYEFLDASIMVQTSPEEAYRKYDELTRKHIESLRKLTKAIQDARIARENEAIKQSLKEYDDALERYIPVLMAQVSWRQGSW